jgi:hypothetical protein
MARNLYTDDFEKMLKDKSDEFRMYPSKRVWHSIYNDLHPSRKWPSVAMSMLLVISLLLIGYLNTSDNISNKIFARNESVQSGNDHRSAGNSKNKKHVALNPDEAIYNVPDDANDNTSASSTDNTVSSLTNTNTVAITENNNSVTDNTNNASPGNLLTDDQSNNISATTTKATVIADNNIVAKMDNYINSNQLLTDVMSMNKNKKAKQGNAGKDIVTEDLVNANTRESNKDLINKPGNTNSSNSSIVKDDKHTVAKNEKTPVKATNTTLTKVYPNDEKSWIEDYAFHNKSSRKKWKDHTDMEFYFTPGIQYRKLGSNTNFEPSVVTSLTATPPPSNDVNKSVRQKPSMGLEAGFGISYAFAKNLKFKAGLQLNYTSYAVTASETNHPVLTTLLLNDLNTGYSYLSPRSTTLTNIPNLNSVTLYNQTYQVSVPIGIAVKIAGKNKLSWYAGATVQPTFVMGAKNHLPSSDYQNYVEDPSLLRKWNLNTAFETYINYKMGGYSLQVGPQFRYQTLSTYSKKYTISEKLYNMGLKIGLVKSF